MPSNQDQIKHLLIKIELLVKKQDQFAKEIQALREDIYQLRNSNNTTSKKNKVKLIFQIFLNFQRSLFQ